MTINDEKLAAIETLIKRVRGATAYAKALSPEEVLDLIAEVRTLRDLSQAAGDQLASINRSGLAIEAERDALRAEVERLRALLDQAHTVIVDYAGGFTVLIDEIEKEIGRS